MTLAGTSNRWLTFELPLIYPKAGHLRLTGMRCLKLSRSCLLISEGRIFVDLSSVTPTQ